MKFGYKLQYAKMCDLISGFLFGCRKLHRYFIATSDLHPVAEVFQCVQRELKGTPVCFASGFEQYKVTAKHDAGWDAFACVSHNTCACARVLRRCDCKESSCKRHVYVFTSFTM